MGTSFSKNEQLLPDVIGTNITDLPPDIIRIIGNIIRNSNPPFLGQFSYQVMRILCKKFHRTLPYDKMIQTNPKNKEKNFFPLNLSLTTDLITGGHVAALEWGIDNFRWDMIANADTHAAQRGQLNILKWLHSRGRVNNGIIKVAAINGRLSIIQWALKTGLCDNEPGVTLNMAASNGHLDIFEWLIFKANYDVSTLQGALQLGSIRVLEKIKSTGHKFQPKCYDKASRFGHLHVVQWLHENQCPRLRSMYETAVHYDHVHIVVWLHDVAHYNWTREDYSKAKSCKSNKVLQWAKERFGDAGYKD